MSTNTETRRNQCKKKLFFEIVKERVKWSIIILLVLSAVLGGYIFSNVSLRVLFIVLMVSTAIGMVIITSTGKLIVKFTREASSEMRKVIWPTYQEAFHITLIVAVVTTIISVSLWGLDRLLCHTISFITGLRF